MTVKDELDRREFDADRIGDAAAKSFDAAQLNVHLAAALLAAAADQDQPTTTLVRELAEAQRDLEAIQRYAGGRAGAVRYIVR